MTRLISIFTSPIRIFLNICSKLTWLPPFLARLTVGIVFIESGWGKIHNIENVIQYFTELGIPAPAIQAPFVAWSEFICGLALLFGLFTRFASLPIICMMLVAILTARRDDLKEATDVFAFIEYLYILLCVWLVVEGAGPISLDRLFRRK